MLQRRTKSIQNRALSASLPAPTGGWNARDSIAAMDPMDAVKLENLFPSTTEVVLRYGHSRWATGFTDPVETVFAYFGLASNRLIAAAGASIYDITSSGPIGGNIKTGLTNARWQYVNYANVSGNYLYMVNGADPAMYWDGSTFTNAAITNVTSSTLIHVNEHKNRLWFVQKDTLKAWYLPTSSINGAATAFDLSGIAVYGGYLMAMATWTMDAGYGVDDMAVFITSQGEVIVYRGTDPASSTTWQLVGVFKIGSPIGRRCFEKFSGDVLIICQDGVQPLSGALQSSRVNPRVSLTDKIKSAISSAVTLYGDNYGWQLVLFPKENQLYLNVPVAEGNLQQQYVMNTITGNWCNFTGWNANCWTHYDEGLYFGGDTYVGKAWDTLADNGSAISADGLQAFNYFESRAKLKRFTMMRPVLQTSGTPSLFVGMNVDFDTSDPTSPLAFTPIGYGTWDVGVWDTALWGSSLVISKDWQGASGIGYCGAPRLKVAASGIEVRWVSTDVVAEPGAIL